ncbi:hypothetical protein DV26_44885 [Amycolatopsis mediterranei]|nr:hypothetical protein DV26_44885 [Amycolatopsis mediterranei]KDU85436.1 hypothetical protein DV36_46390 [Amycolatopsis mediterranei]
MRLQQLLPLVVELALAFGGVLEAPPGLGLLGCHLGRHGIADGSHGLRRNLEALVQVGYALLDPLYSDGRPLTVVRPGALLGAQVVGVDATVTFVARVVESSATA